MPTYTGKIADRINALAAGVPWSNSAQPEATNEEAFIRLMNLCTVFRDWVIEHDLPQTWHSGRPEGGWIVAVDDDRAALVVGRNRLPTVEYPWSHHQVASSNGPDRFGNFTPRQVEQAIATQVSFYHVPFDVVYDV